MSRTGMKRLGWDACDVILVTGDGYVDHPAFGCAVIARTLLEAGYRVGIIAQPDWRKVEPFQALGRPGLFFGVTAGNVDSMVANYTPGHQRRRRDDYAPGGRAGLRPNRAVTVYSNMVRRAYKDVGLVLGGIEASLRRLAHYDSWEDAVRGSLLLDARADVLVYGMGERAVVEIARRMDAKESLAGIPGTCVLAKDPPAGDVVIMPALDEVRQNKASFARAFRSWYAEAGNPEGRVVSQCHGDRYVVQYPVGAPMKPGALDRVYDLPYARTTHPAHGEPVPALETVRFSITSHRGCLGSCTFCSLRAHQGRIIQRRTRASILREAERITHLPGFKGHITDVGGPTANMYAATCKQMAGGRVCSNRECTWPTRCPELEIDVDRELDVLDAVRALPGVKMVTIGTGVRFDLLEDRAGARYLAQLCEYHVSGQLRIAPEHVSDRVLAFMRKAGHSAYVRFRKQFSAVNRRLGKTQYLIPYYISGHPGATVDDAVELAEWLVREERFRIRQVQQFTPLPMTAAGVAYHTGLNPFTGERIHVARSPQEQRLQRSLLQLHDERNLRYVQGVLMKTGRRDLLHRVSALRPFLRPRPGRPTSGRRPDPTRKSRPNRSGR